MHFLHSVRALEVWHKPSVTCALVRFLPHISGLHLCLVLIKGYGRSRPVASLRIKKAWQLPLWCPRALRCNVRILATLLERICGEVPWGRRSHMERLLRLNTERKSSHSSIPAGPRPQPICQLREARPAEEPPAAPSSDCRIAGEHNG